MSEAEAEAKFMADLARALELSKVEAGLDLAVPEDRPANNDGFPVVVAELFDEEADRNRKLQAQAANPIRDDADIDIEPDCAVCMLTIVTPVQLPCKHVFCKACCKQTLDFKWECPMCRWIPPKNFKFNVDKTLLDTIKAKADPEEFERRLALVPAEVSPKGSPKQKAPNAAQQFADRQEEEGKHDDVFITLKYGNRHALDSNAARLPNGRRPVHKWEAFVALSSPISKKAQNFIESVKFTLPTTYPDHERTVAVDNSVKCQTSKNFFEVRDSAWGVFNVQIEIKFKEVTGLADQPLRLNHPMSYKGTGVTKLQQVRLSRAAGEALGIIRGVQD